MEQVGQRIDQLEREIAALQEQLDAARELDRVPGIGVLGSTALAATLGDGKAWRSGREFSASLGLVPAHPGTGGKVASGISPSEATRTCARCSSTARAR